MAKFENEGYCPQNAVATKLQKSEDCRLIGLWSLIGPSMVCPSSVEADMKADADTLDKMFTEDPIAYRLMKSIILYSNTIDKIRVIQNHKGGCSNMQNYETILQTVQQESSRNPILVVESKSQFVVVLMGNEDKTIIDLHFWDLENCW